MPTCTLEDVSPEQWFFVTNKRQVTTTPAAAGQISKEQNMELSNQYRYETGSLYQRQEDETGAVVYMHVYRSTAKTMKQAIREFEDDDLDFDDELDCSLA